MNEPLPIYQIDAFTDRVFGGNPAAVCPLTEWLDDAVNFMDEARALYISLGFAEIPAYDDNPLDGVVYMEQSLV